MSLEISVTNSTSDENNLEQEGDDVYFECLIVSNPAATRLEWYHRVTKIFMRMMAW